MFGYGRDRPYGRDTYRDIERKMAELEDFDGNSMWGRDRSNGYEVFSYATCIAILDYDSNTLYYNEQDYSVTTSHHQHLVRRYLEHRSKYIVDCNGDRETQRAWREGV